MNVPACNSVIVKTDAQGRKYRYHIGNESVPPSRYYIENGVGLFETPTGLVGADKFYGKEES